MLLKRYRPHQAKQEGEKLEDLEVELTDEEVLFGDAGLCHREHSEHQERGLAWEYQQMASKKSWGLLITTTCPRKLKDNQLKL